MNTIDEFFRHHRYALVELDPSQGYGRAVYEKLRERGCEVTVVMADAPEPAVKTAGTIHASLADLDESLDGVVLNIENDPERMLQEVQAAVANGVPRIWIENRCEAEAAVRYALDHDVDVVDNVCALLTLDPNHIHWFHRRVLDWVGKTPQPLHSTVEHTERS